MNKVQTVYNTRAKTDLTSTADIWWWFLLPSFLKGNKHLFEITKLQFRGTDSDRYSNSEVKTMGFYEKRKGNDYMNWGKKFLFVLTSWVILQQCMADCWFYLQKESVINSPVVRMSAFLLVFQTIVCETMLVWPNPKITLPSSNVPKWFLLTQFFCA